MVRTSTIGFEYRAPTHPLGGLNPSRLPKSPTQVAYPSRLPKSPACDPASWNSTRNLGHPGNIQKMRRTSSQSRVAARANGSIARDRAAQWPESFGSLVLLYLTGDKSKVVSAHGARMGKSPLSAVNDGVPRLEWQLVSCPLAYKGTEFNAKTSLSTTRRTRKYEVADGLEFRLCRVRVSGRLFRSHSAKIDRRALGWRSARSCVGATADH